MGQTGKINYGLREKMKRTLNIGERQYLRKSAALVLALVCVLAAACCGKNGARTVEITVPAGSAESFVYSEAEISAAGRKIIVSCGKGLGDTEVILSPADKSAEPRYSAAYLTPGMPVAFDAAKGERFKIGVSVQNNTGSDITVYVVVEGAEVRSAQEKNKK